MVLPKIERIGEVNINSYGHKMTIISYRSERDIEVVFEDGYIKKCSYGRFKSGNVKNNNMPSKYGVGYIGDTTTKCDGVEKLSYRVWVSILDRTLGNKLRSYDNVSISDEWLCYAVFEKWYNENYYKVNDEKMCIDKDVLCNTGAKIYSKDTCIIIPERINNVFVSFYNSETGATYRAKRNAYEVSCRDFTGKKVYLGYYKNKEDALITYREFKIKTIIEVIESYKDKLPSHIYNILSTNLMLN